MKANKKTKGEIFRYLMVLPLVGAADFGVYFLMIMFLPPSASKAISYIVANGVGYLFNKFWIFKRVRKQAAAPEIGRYLILDAFLFGCNILTNQAILLVWPKALFPAVAAASVLTALLSFTCKKCWVFKTATA